MGKFLTPKQEAKMPDYIERYLAIPTKPTTDDEIRSSVLNLCQGMSVYKNKPLPKVLVFDSPVKCAIMVVLYRRLHSLENKLGSPLDRGLGYKFCEVRNELYELSCEFRNEFGSKFSSELDSEVSELLNELCELDRGLVEELHSELSSLLSSELRHELYKLNSELGNELCSALGSEFDSELRSELISGLDSAFRIAISELNRGLDSEFDFDSEFGYEFRNGCVNIWWLYWAVAYDFAQNECNADLSQDKLNRFLSYNHNVTYAIPYENVWFVSRKPTSVKFKNRRLHGDGEQSVSFRDGWGLWHYEGVALREKKYQCHPSQWKPEWIDEEINADVRTALLSGIGYDRWISETGGKVIHEQTIHGLHYWLIERYDAGIGKMLFLKMENGTIKNVFHVEPVEPASWMTTCEKALLWRNEGALKLRGKTPRTAKLKDIDFLFIK